MGFRCRWIASRGATAEQLAARLGFEVQEVLDAPVYDPGVYATALPSGWGVVIADGWDFMHALERSQAHAVSNDAHAIYFHCDDAPMQSGIWLFDAGREVWSLEYDGSNGVSKPRIFGAVPPAALDVARRAEEAQSGEDASAPAVDYIYDVAADIGLLITGFRHDQTLGDDSMARVLALSPPR